MPAPLPVLDSKPGLAITLGATWVGSQIGVGVADGVVDVLDETVVLLEGVGVTAGTEDEVAVLVDDADVEVESTVDEVLLDGVGVGVEEDSDADGVMLDGVGVEDDSVVDEDKITLLDSAVAEGELVVEVDEVVLLGCAEAVAT